MIFHELPKEFINVFSNLENRGFQFTLVGGAVRDYLLNKKLEKDLDFEIRHNLSAQVEWNFHFLQIKNFLTEQNIAFEELPYKIIRFELYNFSIELTTPRIEMFKEQLGHHNFDALIDSNLSYAESFKRRDFSINAIGFELTFTDLSYKLIDPYLGEIDLKNKILRNITNDFYKDPVRFLRLIRFKHLLNFSIDNEILKNMGQFDLTEMTAHYFRIEMEKISVSQFMNSFIFYTKKYDIKLPLLLQKLKSINAELAHLESIETLFFELLKIDSKMASDLATYLSFPKKELKILIEINQKLNSRSSDQVFNLDKLKNLSFDSFKNEQNVELIKYLATKTRELSKLKKCLDLSDHQLKFLNELNDFKCDLNEVGLNDRSYFKIFRFVKESNYES